GTNGARYPQLASKSHAAPTMALSGPRLAATAARPLRAIMFSSRVGQDCPIELTDVSCMLAAVKSPRRLPSLLAMTGIAFLLSACGNPAPAAAHSFATEHAIVKAWWPQHEAAFISADPASLTALYAGPGLDEAEGEMSIAQLRPPGRGTIRHRSQLFRERGHASDVAARLDCYNPIQLQSRYSRYRHVLDHGRNHQSAGGRDLRPPAQRRHQGAPGLSCPTCRRLVERHPSGRQLSHSDFRFCRGGRSERPAQRQRHVPGPKGDRHQREC